MKEVDIQKAKERCARPERICMAVTVDEEGTPNVIPLGWKMWTSGAPPMVAISVAHARYSHHLLHGCGEFVLAWPGEDMSRGVLLCGTKSGRDLNKIAATGWTPLPATQIRPPLIEECPVNLECKVASTLDTGDHTIFVGEIVAGHVSEDDRRMLISIEEEGGYDSLGGRGGYRFGAVRR